MSTWIKINSRYINTDQIAYVFSLKNGSTIVSFNDHGNSDNIHTLEFANDEARALKDYLDRHAADLIETVD